MRHRHVESGQRTVRYHSERSPNSSATLARSVGFPIPFARRTEPPPLLDFEVLCGRFTAIADDFKLDLLTLIQGRQSGPFHRGDMNKHVLPASLRLDEAVAFRGIEPLYISRCHFDASRTVDDVLTQAARF